MECGRRLCDEPVVTPVVSKRSDSIVRWVTFCSPKCRSLEAAVRKSQRRRDAGLDQERERWSKILRKYGITKEEWEALFEAQDGLCAICSVDLNEVVKVCVDHNHSSGEVRGLLCSECNHGLGKFGDDPVRLVKAAEYVTNNATAVARLLARG